MMNNSFYFDHDYTARNDEKILALRSEFGYEGYGIFWAIIESICENKGSIRSQALGGLGVGLGVDKALLKNIVDFCVKWELFYEDNGEIRNHRVDYHFQKRAKLSEAGRKGGRTQATLKPPLSHPKATPKPGEERKEEETLKKGEISEIENPGIENSDTELNNKKEKEESLPQNQDNYNMIDMPDGVRKHFQKIDTNDLSLLTDDALKERLNAIYNRLMSDEAWMMAIVKENARYKMDRKMIEGYIYKFCTKIRDSNEYHEAYVSIKRHFVNWTNKRLVTDYGIK